MSAGGRSRRLFAVVLVALVTLAGASLSPSVHAADASPRAQAATTTHAQPGPPRQSRDPELAGLAAAVFLLLLSLGRVRSAQTASRPRTAIPAAGGRGAATWRLASWVVVTAFVVFEGLLIARQLGGPTIDEALYVASGLRTLDGHGFSDGYLTWFSGSLLWPALSGLAFKMSGLEGARLLALACLAEAMIVTIKATGNLFDDRARFFTAVLLATSGPVLMLAHLAVYDALAVAGVATSFWCVTELVRRDDRAWLVGAALSFSVAVLAKYPTLWFTAVPIVGLLLVLRREHARVDLVVFGFVASALPLILFLSERGQFTALLTNNLALQSETFGVRPRTVAYAQAYFTAVPAILGLAGWFASARRRLLATVLLSGLVGPVAYHLLSQNGVSDHKHAVFGLVFAAPLGGVALARVSRDRPRRLLMLPAIAALGFFGVTQMDRLDRGSPDLRGSVDYLAGHVKPGQQLLINNSWPYIPALYDRGDVNSPWDVFDVYRIRVGQGDRALCDYDWFVEAPGGSVWPDKLRARAERCGTFREVYTKSHSMVGLSNDRLDFIEYSGYARIWRNVGARASR